MKCPKCQFENREGVKFCEECGTKMPSICPECGSEIGPQAKFCGECGAKLAGAAPIQTEVAVPKLEDMQDRLFIPEPLKQRMDTAQQEMEGENRLVTALFADISGFTPMSQEMSPEASVERVNQCFQVITNAVYRYEGSINRFIGDCVLAFFGAPLAHENDPERAILSALDMREAVFKLGLNISVGINTGMMYFGAIGTQEHLEISAYGTDINLAKRLQEKAQPGQILVGAGSYRLTRRAFDFETLSSLSLKGFTQPVTAYSVQQVKAHPEKLRGIEGLRARMIGREREFADLKEAADSWLGGQGQIVSIIGEAGIGKSRLVRELREYLDSRPRTQDARQEHETASLDSGVWSLVSVLEGRCVSIGQPVSYWPFLDILRAYLNLSDADTESEVARKLRECITELFPQRWGDILPFLGRLLSIRFGDDLDDKLAYFTPEQIRHQTLMRLRDVFIAISRRNPLMLILEDLHWSDDLSLDLMSLLMDELAASPLMLLCVYRPEREHRSWQIGDVASRKCLERYTEITLKQLSAVQSRQLVESLLTIENLPEPTKDMILRKSEGNPFFIEEVIRSLIERDLVYREDDRWKARREIEDIDVPDTIQSVLLSRVDRLEAESKYVLQCASVIGRLFRYRLLDHLARHERDLEEHLTQLEERDLVYEERTVPELEYAFKHALTQEATYQGILERRRREFHQRVSDGIEHLYRERIEEFYEELAYHHRLGGNDEKAMEYLLKSGIKLAGQFANQDALRYFDQADELLEKSERPHRKEKATLYEKRAEVLQRVGRWMEALREYEEALKWCDDPHDRAGIYQKMGWLECEEIQDKVSAVKHLELGLKELPEDDRSVQRVRLEHDIAWAFWGRVGSMEDNILRCQRAAKIAEEMGHKRELAILCAAIEKWQSYLGNYSDEHGQKAIAVAEELGDLSTLAWVYYAMGHTRSGGARSGRYWTEQSIPCYLRAIELCERIGDVQTQTMAWSLLGQAYRGLGQDEEAIGSYEKALDIAMGTKSIFPLLWAGRIMAIYGSRGQGDMVISTFSRIMRALASLEIDEESQAWVLGEQHGSIIYRVYQKFRDAYRVMGRESEFPNIARKVLVGLLKDVDSRPQRAWYHRELMDLHLELGDVRSAESDAKEVVSIVDEMGRPDYMARLYPAYLLPGQIEEASGLVRRLWTHRPIAFIHTLLSAERLYERYGYDLQTLAQHFQRTMPDILQEAGITQLVLEPVELGDVGFPELIEQFTEDPIAAGWEWVSPAEGCSYQLEKEGYLLITVLPYNDLWPGNNYAPRLLRAISGDFTMETKVSGGSEGKNLGGLLVWKDKRNFARFEVASSSAWYEGCVYYGGIVAGKWIHPGIHPFEAEEAWLRLERKEDRFTGYVSADGENWYRCGWADIPMEDPIQVGIHALCPVAPTTSTRFEYFRTFRPE